MNSNTVEYWKNYLEEGKEMIVKKDSYLLNLLILDYNLKKFYKWYSFDSKEDVLGFIKFVILPTIYFTRIFGKDENEIIFVADTYENILHMLRNNLILRNQVLIDRFKYEYSLIEEAVKDMDLQKLHELRQSLITFVYDKSIIAPDIHVFKNIKEAIKKILDGYKAKEMIDSFGEELQMPKKELARYLSDVENNKLQSRVIEILDRSKLEVW